MSAYAQVSAGRDVMVLEGGRSMREGYVVGLHPRRVAELLHAHALLIVKYDEALMVDRILSAQNYVHDILVGAVINQVPRNLLERVHGIMVPYLQRKGVPVFGVLPNEEILAAPSVAELADGLSAEILCCADRTGELVEHLLVGAMTVESALTYFRRKANKAVVTGGDRADIQLAALETSTRCLVLTGNFYPSPAVLNRAEELGVPVLLANMDSLACIEIVEGYFGRSRCQQPQKVEKFSALLDENFDFERLYNVLQLNPKG
jgi:uncharacterized protein